VAALRIGAARGVLAKPLTWMNRSGVAARALVDALGGPPVERLLVIVDDLDLPLARLRFRAAGGDGGHNGLRSLIAELGSESFPRLRLGIGRPAADARGEVVDHVLDAFRPDEEEAVADLVERARQGVEVCVAEGVEAAMNRFNRG
jgi:PTH1 family peptidyl-tRNA hydrolase